jgi:Copper binding proteins, plastocyanin/azurin family
VRKLLLLAVLVLAGGLMAVFSSSAPSATRVNVGDNFFKRPSGVPTVTVSKGTRVRWVWVGSNPHNVKVSKGPAKFSSPVKSSGSFSRKMRRRGTYTIVCKVHGGGDQKMKLVVR